MFVWSEKFKSVGIDRHSMAGEEEEENPNFLEKHSDKMLLASGLILFITLVGIAFTINQSDQSKCAEKFGEGNYAVTESGNCLNYTKYRNKTIEYLFNDKTTSKSELKQYHRFNSAQLEALMEKMRSENLVEIHEPSTPMGKTTYSLTEEAENKWQAKMIENLEIN